MTTPEKHASNDPLNLSLIYTEYRVFSVPDFGSTVCLRVALVRRVVACCLFWRGFVLYFSSFYLVESRFASLSLLWDFAKADVCFAREPTDHSSTANPQTWDERLCDQYLHFMLEDIDTPARFLLEESEK